MGEPTAADPPVVSITPIVALARTGASFTFTMLTDSTMKVHSIGAPLSQTVRFTAYGDVVVS